MDRLLTLGLMIIILLVVDPASTAWAQKPAASNQSENKTSQWADDSDVDTEVDNGKGDDASDASTEPSKFKEDSDDSYQGSAADSAGASTSRFKEDAGDTDTEVDSSDGN